MPNAYGRNRFEVFYDARFVCEWEHFKMNNWHTHDYSIVIRSDEKRYLCKVTARGPDGA